MRRVRYSVAMSLDGYIAGPNGEVDWIVMDPEIDFTAIIGEFDTILIGRRTFEAMASAGSPTMPGMKTFVFSRNLHRRDHPEVTIVSEDAESALASLRQRPGKDIWLFGGGSLFRGLAEAGLVDTVEVALIPVLLGAGIPLLPTPASRIRLSLSAHKACKSGIVSLKYVIA